MSLFLLSEFPKSFYLIADTSQFKRGKIRLVKKTVRKSEKNEAVDNDQDQLQAQDECNTEWVVQWKQTVERKKK